MAFSSTKVFETLEGNLRVKYIDATFTAVTSGQIKTGFSHIVFASSLNNTTENDGKLAINIASDGTTAEPGGLYCSSFTSGDTARFRVVGY
jgi:hypothetical protein